MSSKIYQENIYAHLGLNTVAPAGALGEKQQGRGSDVSDCTNHDDTFTLAAQ